MDKSQPTVYHISKTTKVDDKLTLVKILEQRINQLEQKVQSLENVVKNPNNK